MSELNEFGAAEPTRISRRTVTKAMAWAVPTIAVATAAPAFAASPVGPITPTFVGSFCKHPGNPKYYHTTVSFKNTATVDLTVTLSALVVNNVSKDADFSVNGTFSPSYVIPAGQTLLLYVDAGLYGDSANGTAVLSFSYQYQGETITDSILTSIGNLNPCDGDIKGNPPHSTSGPSSSK